ncbi:cytochrome P450 [Podospora fimiseda]|uniref:Cytochrome P450 n=1 Tax=Podospora fimiseda TaxID=252190 RepID=A0AAN7BGX4_9PEZI|nr:cytochrome P450 [Podospora fimiseda]
MSVDSSTPLFQSLLKGTELSFTRLQQDYEQYAPDNWRKTAFTLFAAAILTHFISVAIWRLYLSPLAKIPGPKLAGLTFLYEAYYEVILGGQYFKRVAEMHEQYGPIVRVTPDEVHWNDPEFIDTIYPTTGRKTNKPEWFSKRTGTPDSIVSTPGHDLHRRRRNALNSFFSVASIRRLDIVMKEYTEKMLNRMEKISKSNNQVLQFHHMFKACASDVITIYAFGECFGFMELEDFGWSFFESTDEFFFLTHLFFLIPGLVQIAQNAPAWILKKIIPALGELRDRQDWWLNKVREIRTSPNPERVKSTIFEGIINSPLPASEKEDQRLASEAQLVVFAGEGTTAYSLTCALYHLLDNPTDLATLKAELKASNLDPTKIPSINDVEALPFLNAVIQEAVRLHPGVMARQVRISPETPILYTDKQSGKDYVIPPGTITSMSPLDTHMNESAFENAYAFKPERWIENPLLTRYFHGFSKGTRGCVGMTLARREMAIILASIFLKYDLYTGQSGPTLELYDTDRARDIDANSDYIIPVPAKGSKGLQVLIRN